MVDGRLYQEHQGFCLSSRTHIKIQALNLIFQKRDYKKMKKLKAPFLQFHHEISLNSTILKQYLKIDLVRINILEISLIGLKTDKKYLK